MLEDREEGVYGIGLGQLRWDKYDCRKCML